MAEFNWGTFLGGLGGAISGATGGSTGTTTPQSTASGNALTSALPVIGIGLVAVVTVLFLMKR